MRKIYLHNLFILVCALVFSWQPDANAQCLNTTAYQTNPAPTSGTITLNTCLYSVEYTEITAVAAATNYRSIGTNNTGGAHGYITITDGAPAGPVVAHGPSPFTWTSIGAGTYYMHVAEDAACAGGNNCHTTTLEFLGTGTCIPPSGLNATNIMATTADITFTAGNVTQLGWEVSVVPTGNAAVGGTASPTTTFNATGLSASTTYDAYVREICAIGDTSSWVGPFTFVTACVTATPAYYTDFTTFLPACWDEADNGMPATGPTGLGAGAWNTTSYLNAGGANDAAKINLYFTGTNDWLLGPTFDLSAGGWELVVNAGVTTYNGTGAITMGSDDTVQVLISTNGGTSWTPIYTWDAANSPSNTGAPYVIDLSAYTNANTMFAIWATEGTVDDAEDYDFHINDFEIRIPPACNAPTALGISNLMATSVDLGWTENNGASNWQVEYGAAGFAQGTGTYALATTNPHSLTTLTANTSYSFYVRSICNVGDTSAWAGPFNFATPCAVYTPAHLEDFATFIPACWNEAANGFPATGPTGLGAGEWNFSDYLNNGGANDAVKINLYNLGTNDWLLAPTFDLSAGGWELVINAGVTTYNGTGAITMGSDDTVQVLISTNGGTSWTPIYTWDAANSPSNTGAPYVIDLSAYTNANTMFAIWATEGTVDDPQDFDFHINDFEIRIPPTCSAPSALMVSSLLATSANLGWTENNGVLDWQVQYGTAGFTVGTGTNAFTTSNPHSISGLTANTSYDFYVRTICGVSDTSAWAGPFNFMTPCAAVVAPWLDDVEAHTPTLTFTTSNCWSAAGTAFDWNIDGAGSTPSTGTGPTAAYSGVNYFYVEASNGLNGDLAELTSPLVDITALANPVLEFYYHMFGSQNGVMSDLYIDIYDGSTWTVVDSLIGEQHATQAAPWSKRTVDLSAFAGTIQIKFRAYKNGNQWGDASLDDIAVKEAPSCFDPTTLVINNLNPTSVDLGWTQNGTPLGWQVEYGTAGFAQGTGTYELATTNPHSLTGLMPNTSYDYYVRTICAVGDTSFWVGPFNFMTPCAAVVAPWLDDVEAHTPTLTFTTSNCWSAAGTAFDWNIDGAGSTPSAGTGPTAAYSGVNYFYVEASSGVNGDLAELTTPLVDITALSTPVLEFYYHMFGDQQGVMSDLYIDVYDGSTWTVVDSLIGEQQAAQADPWLKRTINLAAFSGTIQVRFRAYKNGVQYGDVSLDDIAIVNAAPPAELTITEIMYNGPESGTDSTEFIEIYNNTGAAVDVSNWTLTGGTYTFPAATSIAAGAYYVVAVNPTAFNNVFGMAADGQFTNGLSNAGEPIFLYDMFGQVSDSVIYDDNSPWPTGGAAGQPEGGGASIILCDVNSDNNVGTNWSACATPVGVVINGFPVLASPGAANTCPLPPVDVATTMFLNVDSSYCNVAMVTGSVVFTNMTANTETNVPYTIFAGGNPIGGGVIPSLAGMASDTITVGPLPGTTSGIFPIMAVVSQPGDIDTANDTLAMTVYISNTAASASVTAAILCNGDSTGEATATAMNGLGMYNYQWDAAAGNAMTAVVAGLPAGTYYVTVTDSIGCADSAMVMLNEPTAIMITNDTTIHVLCNGGANGEIQMSFAGGTGAYTYLWSNGAVTEDLTGLMAGTYSGTVTDANGCMDSGSVMIMEPTALVASAIDNANGSATAVGTDGTAPYTYMWDAAAANQTDATATGLINGTYAVTVTDANGCMDSTTITITGVGFEDLANVSNLNMFPNPTSGNVFVELELVQTANVDITILNAIGQLVARKELINTQSEKVELETSNLPSGVYLVQFTIGNEQVTRKLIINKQ